MLNTSKLNKMEGHIVVEVISGKMNREDKTKEVDVVLVGAGIMSATLGIILKELEPNITIEVLERMDSAATESSDAWNNAGTGHSAFCELNYTPLKSDGKIDTSKAVKIAESFEESRQFWAYLIKKNLVDLPESFITQIPHMSFVKGSEDVSFLRKRYEALHKCPLFDRMEYSEDPETLKKWMPLIMKERAASQPMAATRMDIGTDVNFGSLTRSMFKKLQSCKGVNILFNHEVKQLKHLKNGQWRVKVNDLQGGGNKIIKAKFVFIGAGGGALPLLLKSGIEEGKGFGGFPVSGQWLRCTNPEIVEQHEAKVYGLAGVDAPPMSVPHLDTRIINGKRELLYGPFAGFTTRFLKHGSVFDLGKSIKLANIWPMLAAGIRNLPLTKYLINQVRLSPEERIEILKDFVPTAEMKDWELEIAGQRVQVIKKDEKHGGILEFGTEIVSGANGSLAALLGASPGASTAVSIMIALLQRCFPEKFASANWQEKIKDMIPSYGHSLKDDKDLLAQIRKETSEVLKLNGFALPVQENA